MIIVNGLEQEDEQGRRIKKRAAVFVEEAQRPMAIGKKGQNIRLATDLTGFELDMYNYEELPAFKAKLAALRGGTMVEGDVTQTMDPSEVSDVTSEEVSTASSLTPDEGQPMAGEGAVAA